MVAWYASPTTVTLVIWTKFHRGSLRRRLGGDRSSSSSASSGTAAAAAAAAWMARALGRTCLARLDRPVTHAAASLAVSRLAETAGAEEAESIAPAAATTRSAWLAMAGDGTRAAPAGSTCARVPRLARDAVPANGWASGATGLAATGSAMTAGTGPTFSGTPSSSTTSGGMAW